MTHRPEENTIFIIGMWFQWIADNHTDKITYITRSMVGMTADPYSQPSPVNPA